MKRLSVLVLLVALASTVFFGKTVSADVNDFVINNFSADYTLTNSDKQGELRVVEKINLEFNDYNHGILRAIPISYKKHKLQLHVNQINSSSGAPTQFTTYSSNGNTVLKIGDPSRTVTGKQEYTIDYTLHNVISFYTDHDELYWDINGDQWQQPFEAVSATFHLPDGLKLSSTAPLCYSGAFGATDQSCQVSSNDQTVKVATTRPLKAQETLTTIIGFEKGFFRPAKWYETLGEYTKQLILFAVTPLIVGAWAFRRWYKYGRDAKGRGTIVPEYDAPDNLKAIEVGGLIDFKVDNHDVTATIIDLAVRKYIKIIETKKDKLIGKDQLDYNFDLINADSSGMEPFEQDLIKGMFGEFKSATIDGLKKNNFYITVKAVQTKISKQLVEKDYFKSSPLKAATRIWVVAGLLALSLFVFGGMLGLAFIAGGVVALVMLAIFAVLMPSRTVKGVAAKEHIEGLKLYLNTAEKDRIKMLQSPNAPYATKSAQPEKTVELFEKLLPYAIVLGVESGWAAQFADIYKEPPDWYQGNWSTFNVALLTSNLSGNLQASVNTAFSPPSSSSSSGFSSGGGFSGGGGGGGGGGGW